MHAYCLKSYSTLSFQVDGKFVTEFQGPRKYFNQHCVVIIFILLKERAQIQTSKTVQSTLISRKSIHTSASLYGKISFSPTVTVFLVTNASNSISSLT